MPTLYGPNSTYDHVLSTDRDRPEDEQVKFTFKAFSKNEWKALLKLDDAFHNAETPEDQLDAANPIVEMGLAGWSNWKKKEGGEFDFNPENLTKLGDHLTLDEFTELVSAVIGQGVTKEDLKKSNSQSASNAEPLKTVTNAPDTTNVKTSQVNTPP